MAGPITAKYRFLKKYFVHYHAEIKRLLRTPRSGGLESDDAGRIGEFDAEALLAPARADLAIHAADKNNPHQETMESIGSYGYDTITNKLANKIPNNVVPVSSYGIVDELTDQQINQAWSGSGYILSCNREIEAILSGSSYLMKQATLDLSKLVEVPSNRTFFVYVRSRFGRVSYQARVDTPPESVSVMYIGKVVTGAEGIVSTEFASVTRIETFRISEEPLGSVIPVTKGTYDAPAPLPAAWNPTQ